MAEILRVDKFGISSHLKDFETGELDENVVVAKNATTTKHGTIAGKIQQNETNYYNLEAFISVGYRIGSKKQLSFHVGNKRFKGQLAFPIRQIRICRDDVDGKINRYM